MPAVPSWTNVIDTFSVPGDVVLVPFADDVTIAGAALQRNRRVILFVRTPAQRLRLRGSLIPPEDPDSRRALALLAATTKRDTPLDRHISNLYRTVCPDCGEPTPATAFIWDPARQLPVAKELTCAACGFQGRAPADDADVQRATHIERRGLSFWFILEWLVDAQDVSGREIARRYLDQYSPRNLAALADVMRKIDAELSDDPAAQRILRLRLLYALKAGRQQPDTGHGPVPNEVERPIPSPIHGSRTVERNVWYLLTHEPGVERIDVPIHLTSTLETFFGASDPAPNIVLMAGPIRQLARQLSRESVKLILGAPPSLDANAWTWEQLWSRWIFGRGSAAGLQPPIGGWVRHVRALGATMSALMPAISANGRAVFRFQDDDPDRAAALLMAMAAHAAPLDFVYQAPLTEPSHLFDASGGVYQATFTPASSMKPASMSDPSVLAVLIENAAVDAAIEVIGLRAEPLSYGWIVTAAMVHLARSGILHRAMISLDPDTSPLAFVKQHTRQGLRAALAEGLLTAVAGDEPTHWWWPESPPAESLSERVERAVMDLLNREPAVTSAEVYRRFPGWLIPEAELVEALLSAYGNEIEDGVWSRRTIDQAERQAIVDAVRRLGERLGFAVGTGIADVVWGERGHATHAFRVLETGQWHDLGIESLPAGMSGYLVVPDRLVNLMRVKLMRNPLWRRELAEHHWTPVKAVHLLALADATEVDRQEFKKIVGLDPIIEQAEAQIPLF